MKNIQVKDKCFTIYLTKEQIEKRVKEVALQINKDLDEENPLFLAILNGSFIFAADIIRSITIPCEVSFIRVSSYQGMSSTGNIKQIMGLQEDIEGRTVVILEDVIDSGLTMRELLGLLEKKHPAAIHVATLLLKPDNLKVDLDIKYRCFDIPNDFIVGYGLDYDGYGRNLDSIYTVVE